MFDGEHLAGAPHTRLYFVEDQHDAVLVAQFAQSFEEARRRNVVTPFTLDRLDEDGRDFLRRGNPVKERLDDLLLLGLVVIGLPLAIVLIGAPIALVAWLATKVVTPW